MVGDGYPSPKSMPFPGTDHLDLAFTPLTNGLMPSQPPPSDFEGQTQSRRGSGIATNQLPSDFETARRMSSLDGFDQFTAAVTVDSIVAPIPATLPSQLLMADSMDLSSPPHEFLGHEQLEADGLGLDTTSPRSPQSVADLRFKSPPPPTNIASRRNRGVPAQLNPTALRSYSYGPKTGIDMTKRHEASPMRRISSATGSLPGRIRKPSLGATPRSPLYLERTKDALMRSLQGTTRSPVMGSINMTLSPVTPSDCLASTRQGAREATVSSSTSDDEQRYTFGVPQSSFLRFDSTLKTPPGTPGIGQTLSSEQVAVMEQPPCYYFHPDEPLITPGLGSFGSEEFSMAPTAPGYLVQSQPPTPSFAPGIGPTYFPWVVSGSAPSNTEYTFPGEYMPADVSAKSSPGQPKSKQFQFTQNITPQDFSTEK